MQAHRCGVNAPGRGSRLEPVLGGWAALLDRSDARHIAVSIEDRLLFLGVILVESLGFSGSLTVSDKFGSGDDEDDDGTRGGMLGTCFPSALSESSFGMESFFTGMCFCCCWTLCRTADDSGTMGHGCGVTLKPSTWS